MYDTFTNIDGGHTPTRWKSYAHNLMFDDALINLPSEYHIGYTMVDFEIPIINTGSDNDYWNASPVNATKLTQENGNIFKSRYAYQISSFKAYINGIMINGIVHGQDNSFTVPSSNSDGYLFIRYSPLDASAFVGDRTSSISGQGIISRYIVPVIDRNEIQRCRRAINNLQLHIDHAVSPWIGGINNAEKSAYNNLIPNRTEIYIDHIIEMQNFLYQIDNKIPLVHNSITRTRPVITSVVSSSYFMVEYLEEIRKAINDLENAFIANLT